MKTLAKFHLNSSQYDAVPRVLEQWQADHTAAMRVFDLEDLIAGCLEARAQTADLIRQSWDLGYAGRIANPDEAGQVVLTTLRAGLRAWEALARAAEEYGRRGDRVTGADALAPAAAEFRDWLAQFQARWPFTLRANVERGMTEIASGRFVDLEELVRGS